MKLSLAEAASVLGKTPHQVRYLLRRKRLKGSKESGQWVLLSTDLPLTEDQRRALAGRLATARESFEKGLEPVTKASGSAGQTEDAKNRRPYSVTDLVAFQVGLGIHRDLVALLGTEDPACARLTAALVLLAQGCHSFQPNDKARHFTEARDTLAAAITEILLPADDAEGRRGLVERIECQMLPKISGLVARQEKRSRRGRYDRFGSFSRAGKN